MKKIEFTFVAFLLQIVFLLYPFYGHAQRLPIKTFNVQDGLPQSQVTTILQDTMGYLWVGTADGLAKFDGAHFVNYSAHNGLNGNNVTCSYLDGDSLIWFGLDRSGISIYDVSIDSFKTFIRNDSLFTHKITAILRDYQGTVWIGTDQNGLYRFDGQSLQRIKGLNGKKEAHISSLKIGPDSNLWVATWNGIMIFKPSNFSKPETFQYLSLDDGLVDLQIENFLFYEDHYIWIGTHNKGLIRARWKNTGSIRLSDIQVFNVNNNLPDNWVRCLAEDHLKNIWVGTAKGAVEIMDPISKDQQFFVIKAKNGLGHNTIDVIFEDREHIIWLGTWGGGLNRYIGKYFETFTTEQGLPDNSVWGVYEDPNHTIWIGTEKGLVGYRENRKLSKLTPRYIFTKKNGLPIEFILTIEGDGHNGMWLGSWGEGLAYIQPYKKQFKHYTVKNGLPSNFVVSLKRDNHGNYWIATLDNGVAYFNPRTGTFKNFNTKNGFPSDKINFIYKDREGNFWFLTKDIGVVRFNGKSFRVFSGQNQRLSCGVTCMFEDTHQNYWFGTPSDGVLVIKKRKGLIRHLTEADGLGGDNIFILAPDSSGHVWIGTKRGLDRFNLRDSTLKHYGFADGFLCLEPDQNTFLRDSHGHLWFGGIGGATRYLPEYENYRKVPPKIVLNKVSLFFGEKELPKDHKLDFKDNHLTFYFTGLSLRNPKAIKYSFKLEGFDNDWSPLTQNNSVTYSNLPPGHYTFLVKAMNGDKLWSTKPASYSFTVVAPFWMHFYFILSIILILILIVYGIFYWRTRTIEKQKILLEKKVKNRTAELEKITQNLREAYTSLKESESKFRILTETISSAVFIYKEEKIVYANHATTILTGYSIDELLHIPILEIVHPDFRDLIHERGLARQRGEKVPNRYEFKIIRKNGEERWIDFTAGIIEYERERAALGTAFDITNRKKAEQAVKESELHLRTLINAMPDIVCFKDGQGRWIEANNFDLQLFELENVPYRGKKDSELAAYSPFYKEAFWACEFSDEKTWQKGTISRGEEVIPARDGSYKIFDVIKVPVFNEDGSRKGLVVIGRDITEKKKVEQELREEKERLSAILSSIHEGLIATDSQYRILFMNQFALDLIGQSEKEILNQNIENLEIIQTSSCGTMDLQKIKDTLQRGEVYYPEKLVEVENNAGKKLLLDVSCSPIVNPGRSKKIGGVVITFRDVSEQKKLEEELFKARKLESLAILAGGLAHDFNNILTAIIGNLSLVKLRLAKTDCPQKLSELLERAETASLRAQGLTQQLLTFSKGGAPVKKAATIQELISSTIEFTLRGSKVRYNVTFSNDLWPVEIDEGQISQVVNNLTINALQAMPEGGLLDVEASNVHLKEDGTIPLPAGRYVKISFRDTGTGIAPEILPRIFDPYFTTKKKGNGLGLASTYSIIKKHGGYITAESELNKGTVFTFFLPASSDKVEVDHSDPKNVNKIYKNARILIMDDEEHIRELVKEILEEKGFDVLQARDGEQAIELFKNEIKNGRKIDLVILDLTVRGGLGGKKTIQELRKIAPGIRAIVSSGYSNDPIMANYREYGFDGVVAKPYKADLLISTVNQILSIE